jgi:hypothetical protein
MADWEPSTIASVTALVVAVIAFIIALAQVLQQYFITGQLIRICDSVVFGPMPGQGRRVWQLSQFRFRVLYSIPQISLRNDLWPSESGYHAKSYAIGRHPLPQLAEADHGVDIEEQIAIGERLREWTTKASGSPSGLLPWRRVTLKRKLVSASWWSSFVTGRRVRTSYTSPSSVRSDTELVDSHRVGEASWVSFCRVIEMPCGNSVRFDHIQYDADRCPSDLISAPMQVSMRDIIIMGLMSGMEVTSASFDEKSISMQGVVGSITSSKHAVLGPILHFTPRNVDQRPGYVFGYPLGHVRGFIDSYWLARTWDVCCVARRYFGWRARRTARRLDDRSIRDQDILHNDSSSDEKGNYGGRRYSSRRRNKGVWMRDIFMPHSKEKRTGNRGTTRPGAEGNEANRRGKEVIKINRAIPERLPQDGEWIISIPPIPPTGQVASPSVGQQGNKNKSGQENGLSTVCKLPDARDAPDNAFAALGSQSSSSQENGTPEDRLRTPGQSRRATVEDVSDHEGKNGLVPEAKNKPEAPFVTEAVVEAVFSERSEDSNPKPPIMSRRATVESKNSSREERLEFIRVEDDKELSERAQTAKKLQATRAEKLRQIQRDKKMVEDTVKRGVIRSPYNEAEGRSTQLLLTNYAHNWEEVGGGNSQDARKEDGEDKDEAKEKPTKEEQEAHERESKRERERMERETAREKRNDTRNQAARLLDVDLYWMSQMDVFCGYWATPWHKSPITPLYPTLTGCVTVVLEALLGFLGSEYIVYTDNQKLSTYDSFYITAVWMCARYSDVGEDREESYNHSYPAYALNARGGVIAAGRYVGCRITSFPSRVVPVLELAHSYDWQVNDRPRDRREVEKQNVELMRIDSWLSYVGRLEEISEGPHRLLRQTPALVHLLMKEFDIDFQNIDLSAKEGGLQDIQGLAANVMDFLTDEELTEAEQLYVLVALLRSVKVAQCVLAGSDTTNLDGILRKDVQAHLV